MATDSQIGNSLVIATDSQIENSLVIATDSQIERQKAKGKSRKAKG